MSLQPNSDGRVNVDISNESITKIVETVVKHNQDVFDRLANPNSELRLDDETRREVHHVTFYMVDGSATTIQWPLVKEMRIVSNKDNKIGHDVSDKPL